MKIRLNKQDQGAITRNIQSIEDLKLHAVIKNLSIGTEGGKGFSQFSQWMVFHQFGRVIDVILE